MIEKKARGVQRQIQFTGKKYLQGIKLKDMQ